MSNDFLEPNINFDVAENCSQEQENTVTSENGSVKKKRVRRTDAQIAADKQAEVDAIRAQVLSELKEQGLLRDKDVSDITLAELDSERSAESIDAASLKNLPIHEILRRMQEEIKVPKLHLNEGLPGRDGKPGKDGFAFRKAEDIIETVKPICNKYGCHVSTDTEIQYCSELFSYIVVTATLFKDNGESFSVKAVARENTAVEAGRSAAQGTGACITYAKKYALGGLFNIDDSSADPDAVGEVAKPGVSPVKEATVQEQKCEPEPAATGKDADNAADASPNTATQTQEAEGTVALAAKPVNIEKTVIKPEQESSPAAEPSGKPVLQKASRNYDQYVTWVATKPGDDIRVLRTRIEEKVVMSDDVWRSLLKDAGRLSS